MQKTEQSNLARLLITCPDRSGIIASISTFLRDHGANITDSDQHSTDPTGGQFFMRLEFQTPHMDITDKKLEQRFSAEIAKPFNMDFTISYADQIKRLALFVSKHDHALLEILWRWSSREILIDIPMIISNHPDFAGIAQHFNIPFHCIPMTQATKKQAEEKMLALCQGKVDGIILARYMQILSEDFVSVFSNRIINIHHSFLPAFMGANPYQQAYDSGVKLIGATAHYVTKDLDMGPIIAQDVVRVSHRLSVPKLKEYGQHIERTVLARAVKAHVEDRIIVDGNKTVVFDAI